MQIKITCNTDDETLFRHIEVNSKRDLEWVKSIEEHDGHAVIVGGGPSLIDCLESIHWRQSIGQKVFALNNAGSVLVKNGIQPDYQVIVDAREENIEFVGNANELLYASQCHPSVIEKGIDTAPLKLWHPIIDGIESHIGEAYQDSYALIGGGTTVGLSAMCLAYTLGYRKLHLYGYDSSYRDGESHAYEQRINKEMAVVDVEVFGKNFRSSLAMAQQAELFPQCVNNLNSLGCVITVEGDGLLPYVVRELNAREGMSEAEKYQEMWKFKEYREVSPGEIVADKFVALAQLKPNDVVIDFGCGTGRGAKAIHDATGCEFILVDFTTNSLDASVANDYSWYTRLIHDLTMPIPLNGVHGFCTDVMEHIRPSDVDVVIRNIMNACEKVFFQISLVEDNCGVLINQQLHLSVFPYEWWKEKFSSLGFFVSYSEDNEDAAIFYVTRL